MKALLEIITIPIMIIIMELRANQVVLDGAV